MKKSEAGTAPKRRKTSSTDICIGRNLRALRLLAGLTQQEVANALLITFQQVQKYEKGINRLPIATLLTLKDMLHTSLESFFTGVPGAPATGPFELPFHEYDDATLKLCQRLAQIRDEKLKRQVGQIIDILAA